MQHYRLAALSICLTLASGCFESAPSEDGADEPDRFLQISEGQSLVDHAPVDFDVPLWPDGRIPYWFDDGTLSPDLGPVSAEHRRQVEAGMRAWEVATGGVIDFYPCERGVTCPADDDHYLSLRYSKRGYGCSVGRQPDPTDGYARFRFPTSRVLNESSILHELGHGIGLRHEHQRVDAFGWLDETAEATDEHLG
ncbi:MAG: hypothetical protein KC561_10480, partial [Myxococcales bacterium]|nr:hypothetical protein [Myxococcales bacterium]